MSEERREAIKAAMVAAIPSIGNHRHHSGCIHNLSPEDQLKARGKTVDWWLKWVGTMPTQITPDDWEIDEPEWVKDLGRKLQDGGDR
jgi:hypothetical protein